MGNFEIVTYKGISFASDSAEFTRRMEHYFDAHQNSVVTAQEPQPAQKQSTAPVTPPQDMPAEQNSLPLTSVAANPSKTARTTQASPSESTIFTTMPAAGKTAHPKPAPARQVASTTPARNVPVAHPVAKPAPIKPTAPAKPASTAQMNGAHRPPAANRPPFRLNNITSVVNKPSTTIDNVENYIKTYETLNGHKVVKHLRNVYTDEGLYTIDVNGKQGLYSNPHQVVKIVDIYDNGDSLEVLQHLDLNTRTLRFNASKQRDGVRTILAEELAGVIPRMYKDGLKNDYFVSFSMDPHGRFRPDFQRQIKFDKIGEGDIWKRTDIQYDNEVWPILHGFFIGYNQEHRSESNVMDDSSIIH